MDEAACLSLWPRNHEALCRWEDKTRVQVDVSLARLGAQGSTAGVKKY